MKRKYKAGALVTNVAQLLDHEYFIVRFGIRNTPKTMHREVLASWQLRICERFVRAGRVSVAERLTNGEYYASMQYWELLDMFDKELCEMCRDMNGLMIPCEGLCCGDVLAARYLSSFRTPPWELNLVFVNTGLEYPEIQKFVNEYAAWLRREFPRVTVNLHRLRPKMNIRQVVTKYGYSIVSKDVAAAVADARHNPNGLRMKRLRGESVRKDGQPSVYNCEKWEFLLDAPFLISDKCCSAMKKSPLKTYAHKTGQQATSAVMAEESRLRMTYWLKSGCNAFEGKRPMGKPMSFWTEQDVLRFIVDHQLPYASVYGDIVASDGENDYGATLIDCKLHCTGCQRTGCMFCAFGAHLEKGVNRFERMKLTHPKHYQFCIGGGAFDTDGLWKPTKDGLGYARVLDYIGVRY